LTPRSPESIGWCVENPSFEPFWEQIAPFYEDFLPESAAIPIIEIKKNKLRLGQ
jgi:hypothetical protein